MCLVAHYHSSHFWVAISASSTLSFQLSILHTSILGNEPRLRQQSSRKPSLGLWDYILLEHWAIIRAEDLVYVLSTEY